MLVIPPAVFRKSPVRPLNQRPPVPPAPLALTLVAASYVQTSPALTLVSASYDQTAPALTLVFNQAVDIGAFNGAAIQVDDAQHNLALYDGGGGVELLGPATVRVTLTEISPATGPGVRLTASGASGIV